MLPSIASVFDLYRVQGSKAPTYNSLPSSPITKYTGNSVVKRAVLSADIFTPTTRKLRTPIPARVATNENRPLYILVLSPDRLASPHERGISDGLRFSE